MLNAYAHHRKYQSFVVVPASDGVVRGGMADTSLRSHLKPTFTDGRFQRKANNKKAQEGC